MSLFPWVVGQTAPVWALTWRDDAGNPVDLTGSTVTLSLHRSSSSASSAGGGTVTLTNPTQGGFTYAPVAGDFTVADEYDAQFKAVLPSGKTIYADALRGVVVPAT